MNATQLYDFANNRAKDSSFVPSLTTGTQPDSQGSSISFALPDDVVVAQNAVPTPYGLPWRTHQNQKYPVTANASAPWVAVPACNANKAKPQARGMGLASSSIASLNLPGKVPLSAMPQRVRAYTY